MKKLIKIQYRGEMSTFDLFYRSIMYDSSKSILSSKGILSPKAFLRIIRSLWRALWSTYLTWICFLNLGLIIAKKLLATLSLVKFILWLFLPDHFHKFWYSCSNFLMFIAVVAEGNSFTWTIAAFVLVVSCSVTKSTQLLPPGASIFMIFERSCFLRQ